ncbi:MAG: hypothetical protein IKR64_04225, partial [Treponema sp.]|nr:hypothetical protein [Treponema sp.]
LQVACDCPTYDMPGYAIDDTSQYTGKNNVPYIDSASAWDKENKRLTVFVINRNQTEEYPLELDIRGFEGMNKIKHYELYSKDFDKKSSYQEPWKEPELNKAASISSGLATTKIKPLSWNVIVFEE